MNYKTSELPNQANSKYTLPALTAGIQNQGLNNFVPRDNASILKNVITISANGANTGVTFYQNREFTVLQDAYAIKWIYTNDDLKGTHYLFLVSSISKTIFGNYDWTNKAGWEKIKSDTIHLPTKHGKIDFEFMESFIAELEAQRIAELEAQRIAELEAYLLATGLKDYTLTAEEENALDEFDKWCWKSFNLEELFGRSTRGKRLKSADRVIGDLPFVTAGEADTGISAYIGNKVEIFPKNTTTIDMFGSAKYRNYPYGGDDHIAVVHTEALPQFAAVFVTTSIHKSSYTGKFSYSRNFYAKDADELNILLPTLDTEPDYKVMETFISAIQKLVIKDVVLYSESKINATKLVISK